MRMTGNTVLITGGSSGIGLAIARELLATGNTVIVCGRDQARLERATRAVPGIHSIRCDITREDERATLLRTIASDFPRLNMLVNNAAVMYVNDSLTIERIEAEVRTNLLAPMELSTLFLPLLQQQATAAIVIVSSGLAYVPVANAGVYCATKAALHSFSRSIRYRLKTTAIQVFELLPPLVDTDLTRALRMPKIPAERVAGVLLKAMARDRYEVRVGMVKPLRVASPLAPWLTARMLNRAFSIQEYAVKER